MLNIIKPNAKKEKVTFRNIKDVDMGAVFSDLDLDTENYENIVEDMGKKLDKLIEKVEPKQTKVLTVWNKESRLNSDIKIKNRWYEIVKEYGKI